MGRECLQRRAWTVCRFKRRVGKKGGGGVFEGGLNQVTTIVPYHINQSIDLHCKFVVNGLSFFKDFKSIFPANSKSIDLFSRDGSIHVNPLMHNALK